MYNEQIEAIYTRLLNPDNYLEVHDYIYEQCPILNKYMLITGLRLANIQIYLDFIEASANSKHGHKQLVKQILNHFYIVPPYLLEYNHPANKGLPGLSRYINIASCILNKDKYATSFTNSD